ncbi:hypothetical protein LTR84_001357 [Exophiala bonariae]|uniref:Cytochrome c domain-containing protein n=1 Tax=Exophiala bonariae TaxID=1690606 RepID=A0AAV9NEK9_9EURO|nr:hypothetical protein LTR84_001357 [Exophiala bonariae]
MSKSRSNPINSLSLHEAVSSTLKRQHVLGAVPAAMRFIPLGALAAKELYERQMGKLEVLSGPEEQILKLETATSLLDIVPGSARLWGCASCHAMHSKQNQMATNSIFVSPSSKQHSHAMNLGVNNYGVMRSPEG